LRRTARGLQRFEHTSFLSRRIGKLNFVSILLLQYSLRRALVFFVEEDESEEEEEEKVRREYYTNTR